LHYLCSSQYYRINSLIISGHPAAVAELVDIIK